MFEITLVARDDEAETTTTYAYRGLSEWVFYLVKEKLNAVWTAGACSASCTVEEDEPDDPYLESDQGGGRYGDRES